jgi:ABC-type lipoprotein export system ATPase subunit
MAGDNIKNKTFKQGATWLRADFHLHTKSDKEFKYDGEENDFNAAYVDKLAEQGIQVAAITNHNKFNVDEYKALRKTARKKEIYLLPGIELSVKDGANGIHCLVIFDPKQWVDDGCDYINHFLTSTFAGKHNYENENRRSNDDLHATIKKLNDFHRGYFIIMAHVEQRSGFLEEFDGGRIEEFAKDPLFRENVLAFQKVRTRDYVEKLKQWFSNKLPAFIEGSDPKMIEDIGKGEKTFLKIGDFNFEAVKYALLDYENRVCQNEIPQVKNGYIKSIRFEGGKLDGIDIDFSPELNNFIGIRGSGKSTILELIRYTLGIPLTSVSADKKYKDDLVQFMLGSGGKSVLTIVNKDGEECRVEKIYGQKEDIYKNDTLVPGISLEGISFDQPIFFGQKDLSNKDADFESDLMNRLIGYKLSDKQNEIEAKTREITRIVNDISQLENLEEVKKDTVLRINNAREKLQKFKELGVEEKLKQQTQFDDDIARMNEMNRSASAFIADLAKLIENHDYFFSRPAPGSGLNKELFEDLSVEFGALKNEYEALKLTHARSEAIARKMNATLDRLKLKKEGLKEEFAKIKREVNSDNINPDDFLNLNRIIETSRLKLLQIEKSEEKRGEYNQRLHENLTKLNQLWLEKHRLLENETLKINEANSNLAIEVEFKGKRHDFKAKLKDVFRGTNIYDTAYEKIVEEFRDFVEIFKDSDRLRGILNENQKLNFMNRLNENLSTLLTYEVGNEVTINYNGKPLNNHSLGQRASALILFLLAQRENDVLIIDQPEDDLDNQTIYDEVIKEIKQLKGEMQFIFATHNANIPVLGDSEKVVACSFDNAQIEIKEGSVDDREIQHAIVDIMEGGEEAFTKRKNIYTIWKIEEEHK